MGDGSWGVSPLSIPITRVVVKWRYFSPWTDFLCNFAGLGSSWKLYFCVAFSQLNSSPVDILLRSACIKVSDDFFRLSGFMSSVPTYADRLLHSRISLARVVFSNFVSNSDYPFVSSSASSPITSSWIGSINALLVISMGLVAGRLYDRGYLCVI